MTGIEKTKQTPNISSPGISDTAPAPAQATGSKHDEPGNPQASGRGMSLVVSTVSRWAPRVLSRLWSDSIQTRLRALEAQLAETLNPDRQIAALGQIVTLIPDLRESERLAPLLAVSRIIRSTDYDMRQKATQGLQTILPGLSARERLALALTLEPGLDSMDPSIVKSTLGALKGIYPGLNPEDFYGRILRLKKTLAHSDMEIRGVASDLIDFLISGLNKKDTRTLALTLAEGLKKPGPYEEQTSPALLERLAQFHLEDEPVYAIALSLVKNMAGTKSWTGNPGLKALAKICPHLSQTRRLHLLHRLKSRFEETQDPLVGNACLYALAELLPFLEEEERGPLALYIQERLDPAAYPDLFFTLTGLEASLNEEDRLALARQAEAGLDDPSPDQRDVSVRHLRHLTPHLRPEERPGLAVALKKRLMEDSSPRVRLASLSAISSLIPRLSRVEDRLDLVLAAEKAMARGDSDIKRLGLQTLAGCAHLLHPSDRLARAQTVMSYLNTERGERILHTAAEALESLSRTLTPEECLTLIPAAESALESPHYPVRMIALRALAVLLPTLSQKNILKALVHVKKNLLYPEAHVRAAAADTLDTLMALLDAAVKSQALDLLWKGNPLARIEFIDGGGGINLLPHIIRYFLPPFPQQNLFYPARVVYGTAPEGILEGLDIPKPRGLLERSRGFKPLEDQTTLVFKGLRPANKNPQTREEISRELILAQKIREAGIPYRSRLILPLGNAAHEGREGIVFRAPKDYYRYLTDKDVTDKEFETGLFNAVHDAFLLARHGFYHLVPIRLFHNTEFGHDEGRQDTGIFTWIPDLTRGITGQPGMGRLDNWNGSLEFGNYGVSGLRDLEEVFTLTEITGPTRLAPELESLNLYDNKHALYDMALLGNHLLAATLYIGNRMRDEARLKGEAEFWKDDDNLKPYAGQLHRLFALAYQVKQETPDEDTAREVMAKNADWLQLARQMAFFMTGAYINFVAPGSRPEDFPESIYGPGTQVEIGRNYRGQSFDPKHGWLDPRGRPGRLSLGPVNGQFPIREFERAAYAVFIPRHRKVRAGLKTRPRAEPERGVRASGGVPSLSLPGLGVLMSQPGTAVRA